MMRAILYTVLSLGTCLTPGAANAAITLSLQGGNIVLESSDTAVYTVFLDVNDQSPDPTVPFDSIPTPMTDFNFSVDLSSVDGGALQIVDAANAAAFSAGSTTNFNTTSAIFGWSGPAFELGNDPAGASIELGSFEVAVAEAGLVDVRIRETRIGNTPSAGTADFVFENSSIPFGGDDQLFTEGPNNTLLSTTVLAQVTAVPEPASGAFFVSAFFATYRRRK